jgi:UDP-N-acetylmuramate dehydrogenase
MVLDPADTDTWSCGSFFTNPVLDPAAMDALVARVRDRLGADVDPPVWPEGEGRKTSAAWLIERAGFGKGHGLPGPAALSTKHPLAVTNRGSATTADVLALAREVRDGVEAAFGIRLVNEPVLVGERL